MTIVGTAKLKIRCPKMRVVHQSKGLSLTDRLEAPSELTLPNGLIIAFFSIFPPTFVRQQKDVRHWLVDLTPAFQADGSSLKMSLILPPEPCEVGFDFHDGLYMTAEKILALGSFVLVDGSTGVAVTADGETSPGIVFPAVKSRWMSPGVWTVGEVMAYGNVEFFADKGDYFV